MKCIPRKLIIYKQDLSHLLIAMYYISPFMVHLIYHIIFPYTIIPNSRSNCARRVKTITKMYIQSHYRVFRESKKRFLPFSTIQDSIKFLPKTVYNRISYKAKVTVKSRIDELFLGSQKSPLTIKT